MARMKKRRYAGGGEFEATDDIVVKGKRPSANEFIEASQFDLSRMGPSVGAGSFGGGDMGGGGGSQRVVEIPGPRISRPNMRLSPAIVRSERSELSDIMGDKAPRGYGAKFSMNFAKGGKAGDEPTGGKKRGNKAKRYSTGGKVSSASKRADGCATKGKTKGRMV